MAVSTLSGFPVLVTLETGGWTSKIVRHVKQHGFVKPVGTLAIHDPIAHMLCRACVRILPPPEGYLPLVDGRNIYKILEHESLHHVLNDFFVDSNRDTLDSLLNSLPDGCVLKKRLAFGV